VEFGIAGRSAFVAGGTRGIGFAIARELAREGAKVLVASRDPANVAEAVAVIRGEGGTAAGCSADCADRAGLAKALDAAKEAHGAPLIAVMVPNSSLSANFANADEALFEAGQRQLILPLAQMARAVIPAMREAQWGRIISIASMSVRMAHRNVPMAVPDTYRLASVGLVKTLSDELGPFGITANSVAPGSTMTEKSRAFFTRMAQDAGTDFDTLTRQRSDRCAGRRGRTRSPRSAPSSARSGQAMSPGRPGSSMAAGPKRRSRRPELIATLPFVPSGAARSALVRWKVAHRG
jgi:3-oxoacyl-[acyl-carrier protein] reductase